MLLVYFPFSYIICWSLDSPPAREHFSYGAVCILMPSILQYQLATINASSIHSLYSSTLCWWLKVHQSSDPYDVKMQIGFATRSNCFILPFAGTEWKWMSGEYLLMLMWVMSGRVLKPLFCEAWLEQDNISFPLIYGPIWSLVTSCVSQLHHLSRGLNQPEMCLCVCVCVWAGQ